MRGVVALAVGAVVALVVAVVTGSGPLAVVVVALALAGIIGALRGWRAERAQPVGGAAESYQPQPQPAAAGQPPGGLSPDDFTPDISTDPNGPSSDARADHA